MQQQRIFKLLKEHGQLKFSTLLYNYRPLDNANQKKKISSKVESDPTVIDEAQFMAKVDALSGTTGFLYPGTIWASVDNRSFIITEPRGIKDVFIKDLKRSFRYPHPNVAYYITKSGVEKPYVAGMWFYLDDVITERTQFYAAWSLNVFRTGFICTHNVYADEFPKGTDYNIMINTAIEDFWNGNFNSEVSDLTKSEIYRHVDIIKLKNFKNDLDWFYQQLEALANNYTLNSEKFKAVMTMLAGNYYKAGSFPKLVNAIMRNNPQTQMASSQEDLSVLSNNYLISDIITSAYSTLG